jgi:hypothetical protein
LWKGSHVLIIVAHSLFLSLLLPRDPLKEGIRKKEGKGVSHNNNRGHVLEIPSMLKESVYNHCLEAANSLSRRRLLETMIINTTRRHTKDSCIAALSPVHIGLCLCLVPLL